MICSIPGPLNGKAASRLYIPEDPEYTGKEYARILVTEEFLSLEEEEKFLTLIHESVHIASTAVWPSRRGSDRAAGP